MVLAAVLAALVASFASPDRAEAAFGSLSCARIDVETHQTAEPPRPGNTKERTWALQSQDFRLSVSTWIHSVQQLHAALRAKTRQPGEPTLRDEIQALQADVGAQIARISTAAKVHLDRLAPLLQREEARTFAGSERTKLIWIVEHLSKAKYDLGAEHFERADSWARVADLTPRPPTPPRH
jgi:hypothetical protein